MEKFGILNLLKAIETLTPPPAAEKSAETEQSSAPAPPPQQPAPAAEQHNLMATILARPEDIANRVKNNRR